MTKKILFFGFFILLVNFAQAKLNISYENPRHTFLRGEVACIELSILNDSNDLINDVQLNVSVDDVIKRTYSIITIESAETVIRMMRLDTSLLKSGSYNLSCRVESGQKTLAKGQFALVIAMPWNPDRMRVWLWPHASFGKKVYKLNDESLRQLNWYADKGFNSFHPGGGVLQNGDIGGFGKDKLELFDYALSRQWEISIKPLNAFAIDMNDASTKYQVSNGEVFSDPYNPKVVSTQNTLNRDIVKAIVDFPAVKMIYFESEYEDYLNINSPMAKRFYPEIRLPESKHLFIMPGVIDDNDENYLQRLYHYKWGDGVVVSNQRATELFKRYRQDIFAFSDPFRLTAIYDRFTGLDALSTWTYTNPDPKFMLYIESLIAAAKPLRQKVVHTVTMLNYPGAIFPKSKGWAIMGPDELVETSWINLSRRPDALAIYTGSMCDVFDANNIEPIQKYSASFEAFKMFINKIVKPYGPMVKRLERLPRRVAVLSSESSRLYSASPNLAGHYANYQIYHFYTLLNMIHIPADIIFDETILRYGLDDYDMLVLPKCDTLVKSVFDEIIAFQKRGGVVISDQYLRAPIPQVTRFYFDFTYRANVTADAIKSGKTYEVWDDHVKAESARFKDVNGITALDDQKIMEKYAQQLQFGLKDKFIPNIECSSPTALLNALEKDGVIYLFVINDKRDYGTRLGQYKAILEKALPQTVSISIKKWKHMSFNAYDIIDKKLLPSIEDSDGHHTFDVNLPAPGGKIIVLRPDKIRNIDICLSSDITIGNSNQLSILLRDEKGNLIRGISPVQITIIDPNGKISQGSDFYAAESGIVSFDFFAALNDTPGKWKIEVKDLTSGLIEVAEFKLEKQSKI